MTTIKHLREKTLIAISVFVLVVCAIIILSAMAKAEPANTYIYVSNYNSDTVSVLSPIYLSKIVDIKTDVKPSDIIINPAGTYLYVAYDGSGYIDKYSTIDYSLIKRIRISNNNSVQLTRMTMNPEGTRLYATLLSDGSVYVIDMITDTVIAQRCFAGLFFPIAQPAGIKYYQGYLYVAFYDDDYVVKLDASTLATVTSYGNTGNKFTNLNFADPQDVTIDTLQYRLIVNNMNTTATIVDLTTNGFVGVYNGSANGYNGAGISFNSSGYLYRSEPDGNSISIFNTSAKVATIDLTGYEPLGLTHNIYNSTVFVALCKDGGIGVINGTNQLLGIIQTGNRPYRVSMGTQATPATHATMITVQSLFGTVKLENIDLTLYDENNILQFAGSTDSAGSRTFYVNPSIKYKVTAYNASQGVDETGYINPGASSYQFNIPFTSVLATWLGFNGLTEDTFLENQSTYTYTLDTSINRSTGDAWVNVTYDGASITSIISFLLYVNNSSSMTSDFVDSASYFILTGHPASAYHNFSLSNAAGKSYIVKYDVNRAGESNMTFYRGSTFPGPKVMPGFPLNWYYWFGFLPLFFLYGAGTITRKGPIALMGAAWMAIATGFGWFDLYVSDTAMGMCVVIAIILGILMWISEQQTAHTVGGIKTMQITLVILIFSLLTAMFSYTGALPNVNTAATSSIDKSSLNQLTTSQTISSDDPSGYAGLFIQGVKILFTIGQIILGTLVVAVPLMNMGVPWWLALAVVQPILYALAFFDLLPLWRGIQWN